MANRHVPGKLRRHRRARTRWMLTVDERPAMQPRTLELRLLKLLATFVAVLRMPGAGARRQCSRPCTGIGPHAEPVSAWPSAKR